MEYRTETDSLGEVKVPNEKYYGAQTQRSLENFPIGIEKIPTEIVHAFGTVKKAAALTNCALDLLSKEKTDLVVRAAEAVEKGELDTHFPLVVWQTGSGTQSNMNANEVISNFANEIAGEPRGTKKPIHPNDDVNKSQSSNDIFPSVEHVACATQIHKNLLPSLQAIQKEFTNKSSTFADLVKVGRTHLMDAVPLTLGQEFSAYASQIEHGIKAVENALPHLCELALGGTAVGTGINTHPEFAKKVAEKIAELTSLPFTSAPNKFEAISADDAMVEMSGALKRLAVSLYKIANDIRYLASGPRCGLGEITLPANEPGSSIMPGKVNPTQCEALTMACIQVMGNDVAIGIAGSQGAFQLNANRPIMAHNLLQSIRLLADACNSFRERCLIGIEANREKLTEYTERSLMLVTALNPVIGYDKAAQIAKKAHAENTTLKAAALELGYLSEKEFDEIVDPKKMV